MSRARTPIRTTRIRRGFRRLPAAVVTLLCCAACGHTTPAPPAPPAPAPPPGVGNFQWQPRTLGHATTLLQARTREAQRLADFVVVPDEVDPDYVIDSAQNDRRNPVVLDRRGMDDIVANDTFDDVARELVAGWIVDRLSAPDENHDYQRLSIAVLEFPDTATASAVATRLEHDDFTYHRDNEPVRLERHPETAAHRRPQVPSIGSWTSHRQFVVFVKAGDDRATPDPAARSAELGRTIERTLDLQVPLLDRFTPTPAAELATIDLDPDGMLGRTLELDSADVHVTRWQAGVFSGRGGWEAWWAHGRSGFTEHMRADALTAFRVERITIGDTAVARTDDTGTAQALFTEEKLLMGYEGITAVDPPTRVADEIACFTDPRYTTSGTTCLFRVGRYVAKAVGNTPQLLGQQITAQRTLLVAP